MLNWNVEMLLRNRDVKSSIVQIPCSAAHVGPTTRDQWGVWPIGAWRFANPPRAPSRVRFLLAAGFPAMATETVPRDSLDVRSLRTAN